MRSVQSPSVPVAEHPGVRPRRRIVAALAGVVALASLGVSALWWRVPTTYPYGPDDAVRVGLNHLVPSTVGAPALAVAGTLGLVLAAAAVRPSPSSPRLLVTGSVVLASFFGFVLADAALVSTLGYVMALSIPVLLVALPVLLLRHRGVPARITLPVLGVLVVAGAALGLLAPFADGASAYYGGLFAALDNHGPRVAWSWAMALTAAVFAALALSLWQERSSRQGRSAWSRTLHTWGRRATIGAALMPLPYGLIRLTWLTPWPLGGNGEIVVQRPLAAFEQAHGALLGGAALLGSILTLGLISTWGRTFPSWVPVLGGRPVPVSAAVLPGLATAAVMTISAPGLTVASFAGGSVLDGLVMMIFFPLPLWGPLLGFAVLAYRQRRLVDQPAGARAERSRAHTSLPRGMSARPTP